MCAIGHAPFGHVAIRDRKKAVRKTSPPLELQKQICRLACSYCSSNNQKQHDRNDDTARRCACFFNNYGWLDDRLGVFAHFAVAASESGCCGDGQCSSECDFLHSNLQNVLTPSSMAPTPKTMSRRSSQPCYARKFNPMCSGGNALSFDVVKFATLLGVNQPFCICIYELA